MNKLDWVTVFLVKNTIRNTDFEDIFGPGIYLESAMSLRT